MTMPAPILETRRLSKRFGGFLANDAIDFAVAPGEIRGIIGPNGAGKSTLVNLMTGVHAPSSGEVLLAGESLVGLKTHEIARKGLARSFQVSRVFGNLSLIDNLLAPHLAQISGKAGREAGLAKGWRFLELTGLARLAHQPAKALSGGQRVLLQAAAGFMIPSLSCYLLDEPFAGVNPVIKDQLMELIEEENRARALTFVVVSHEMAVMRRLCHKITVLIEGRVVAEGSLDEVAARPDVIKAYLGKSGEVSGEE
ncbi:amino acid/amide ABC transporter ATP-binding protein 1, HAAT family [Rhizobiales bacterium GAS191]|nr:branched-chain amino acid transport system ATP-binding protein [Rhizobiales bacterium GAS113]SEC27472.1 amino acid/amide ABC transporter ATP-binding protein 1, HAAT family [Rhizobiales bacterium GAS191]SEC96933.1 branched-chain amino acid transport system ATP-binding protein [Rhizobiales bacterium GAS188]